jgi:RNA polymerase sigma-70 factor, ECF subfamily
MADDAALVVAVRAGSRDAWDALFRRHASVAWRVAVGIVGRPALAEEVVQDAFVSVLEGFERFDGARPFRPCLLRIVANRALNVARGERRVVLPGDGLHPEAGDAPEPFEDAPRLLTAVRALPADDRALVALRYWADLAPPEIAELLGVPVGTVWSRLSRVVGVLRNELEVTDRG